MCTYSHAYNEDAYSGDQGNLSLNHLKTLELTIFLLNRVIFSITPLSLIH